MGCCSTATATEMNGCQTDAPLNIITKGGNLTITKRSKEGSNTLDSLIQEKTHDLAYLGHVNKGELEGISPTARLKVQCDPYEILSCLWVEENETLKFRVFGEWQPDPSLPQCSCRGFPTYTMKNYNYGSLVGRVLGGDYFLVDDFGIYESKNSGPLFFKMHSPRFSLQSSGALTVHIYGGKVISKEEMNRRIGWEIEKIYSNVNSCNLSYAEQEVVIDLNKMRINPKLYSIQYIDNDRVKTHKFLQMNDLVPVQPFNVNQTVLNNIADFYKNQEKNYMKKNTLDYLDGMELNLLNYMKHKSKSKVLVSVKLFDKCLPHRISLVLLQNEKIRKIIFNGNNNEIAIKVIKTKEGYLVIICFLQS